MSDSEIHAWHFGTRQSIRLRWSNGIITALESLLEPPPEDLWVAPALFDCQINGYAGVDFQQDEVTRDEILLAVRRLREAGCAKFLLALVTDEWSKMTGRLKHYCGLREQCRELRSAIAGWHMEGPFLSSKPGFHGAHRPELMCDPSEDKIRELREISGQDPLLLTVAPERSGSMEAIALARSLGITVSLGHTDATTATLGQALEAGATAFTHLGNACPQQLDRHDNILWRIFEIEGLTVSLIPDGLHVSPPLFRLIHRQLPMNSIYYTTDAMAAAGAGPGKYNLANLELEVGADEVVRVPGKSNFSGSALRPVDGVFRAAKMLRRPWQEAWTRFSDVPAKFMGQTAGLEIGAKATFCLLKFSAAGELPHLRTISSDQF